MNYLQVEPRLAIPFNCDAVGRFQLSRYGRELLNGDISCKEQTQLNNWG